MAHFGHFSFGFVNHLLMLALWKRMTKSRFVRHSKQTKCYCDCLFEFTLYSDVILAVESLVLIVLYVLIFSFACKLWNNWVKIKILLLRVFKIHGINEYPINSSHPWRHGFVFSWCSSSEYAICRFVMHFICS